MGGIIRQAGSIMDRATENNPTGLVNSSGELKLSEGQGRKKMKRETKKLHMVGHRGVDIKLYPGP